MPRAMCVCVHVIFFHEILTLNIGHDFYSIIKVLFGAIALTVHETYEKVVNFTFPISVQSYGMMIPRPKELSRLYLFIAPFSLDVRTMILSFIFCILYPILFSLFNPFHLFAHTQYIDLAVSYTYDCNNRPIVLWNTLSQPVS